MTRTQIAVLGAGIMGRDHADNLSAASDAEVTWIADVDGDRAAELARGLDARSTIDPLQAIDADDVDAVVIASHDTSHAALVLACISAGKPVLCEKPLALTVTDCERIVAAEAPLSRRLVSVGFSRRFDPAIIQLRETVARGEIGRPLLIHARHRNVSPYPGGDSASSILNSGIHELDQLPWMLGSPITEVAFHAPASTGHLTSRQDPQLYLIRTADGVLSTVEVFVNARYGYDVRCEVVGEDGVAALRDPAPLHIDRAGTPATGYPADWRPRFAQAYRNEVAAWLRSIRGASEPDLAAADDGLRATAAAAALVESMRRGGGFVGVGEYISEGAGQ